MTIAQEGTTLISPSVMLPHVGSLGVFGGGDSSPEKSSPEKESPKKPKNLNGSPGEDDNLESIWEDVDCTTTDKNTNGNFKTNGAKIAGVADSDEIDRPPT